MKIILLFHIPHPLEWTTSQIANIISLVGTIATVWTLVYAIRQGIKNSKEINQLAEQNKLIVEQINLQKKLMQRDAMPDFVPLKPITLGQPPEFIEFPIKNEGKDGRVAKVVEHSGLLELKSNPLNLSIKEGYTFILNFERKTEIPINDIQWHLVIEYTDFYLNPYILDMKGKGDKLEQTLKLIIGVNQ